LIRDLGISGLGEGQRGRPSKNVPEMSH
jgi:hypothetical protein